MDKQDTWLEDNTSLAHFLAQTGHETQGFTKSSVTENLYYKTEERLKKVFGKYFTKESGRNPEEYLRNPEKLANVTYGGRMGNGKEATGEGYKFRGRGIAQLTGKYNYSGFTKAYQKSLGSNLDFVANPDLIADDLDLSIQSGFWFYKVNVVDQTDIKKATVRQVTELFNGGLNGLNERTTIYNNAVKILNQ